MKLKRLNRFALFLRSGHRLRMNLADRPAPRRLPDPQERRLSTNQNIGAWEMASCSGVRDFGDHPPPLGWPSSVSTDAQNDLNLRPCYRRQKRRNSTVKEN
jgi:hypothetical protein